MEQSNSQKDRMAVRSAGKGRWLHRVTSILAGQTIEEVFLAGRINISQPSIHSFQNMGLFAKLPPEIRLQVYEYLFANQAVLHLWRDVHQLRHFRCFRPMAPPSFGFCSCFGLTRPEEGWLRHIEHRPAVSFANGNLALLRTCRQIYGEGIDLVYTHNIFSVRNLIYFLELAEYILTPDRLATIRHLRVECRPLGYPPRFWMTAWELFWDIVATKMRLTSLHVFLVHVDGHPEPENLEKINLDEPWVQPMLAVKGIGDVRVEMVWDTPCNEEWTSALQQLAKGVEERMRTRTEGEVVEELVN